ncbi:hypothetical protein [Metabacillus litoralis]|uniref:hypothetical protein n=1 Tax=Metabacillus litoralis TaxID=152268 RepID=UPI00203C2495|nr:hypothetical protein [Metabacillus litoralis]MCM3413561.1 hypothetical protein [Metabacillus litoralis]
MNDLYSLLMRREAKLVMKIENTIDIEMKNELIEQKKMITKRRLKMKLHIKESA